ncbi:ABC transporter substrate-binding protein [Fusobacterium necrophorum]|uniref:ABC transporter substrate-binding protein n=1 Tax=Fusobacterium necrophorum TaxID=859 RepID=UPI00370EEB61
MKITKYKIILMLFLLLFVFISCGKQEAIKEEQDIILREEGGDFGYPNPFRHQNRGPGFFKMELIYDSLLEKDEKGLIPWLAKEWEVSEDGQSFTFTLVENAKWQDGVPLTPEDVAFSIKYFEEHPPVRGGLMLHGKYLMDRVEIEGNKIKIHTPEYTPTALEKIGSMRILPKHIWEKVTDPEKFSGEGDVMGSGPYKLVSYNPEQGSYKMEWFDEFWGWKPAVKAIEWIPVSDKVLAFQNGEIDITLLPVDLLPEFEKKKEFVIKKNFGLHNYRLYFNFDKIAAFKNKKVRQAMAYTIDRKELIEKLERGAGLEGSQGYLPPTHEMYYKDLPKYSFDMEKAKELMSKELANGETIEVEILVGNSPKEVKMAELLKIRLEEIGILLKVVSIDGKARDSKIKNYDYEMAIVKSGGMGGDADMLREIYSSKVKKPNLAAYENEELEKLLYQQSIEKDKAKRKKVVEEIQKLLAEEIPMMLLYGEIDNTVYRPEKYNRWTTRYDHTKLDHPKLSYIIRPE